MDETPPARQPAPGALALVQDFVNSAELPGGYDELVDIPAAVTWLQAHGFHVVPDEAQRRRLVAAREQLRTFLGINQGLALPEDTANRLPRMLNAPDVYAAVDADGVHLVTHERGVDGLLASILIALVGSTIDGTLRRLKVCRSDSCQWTFFDSSKNGSGTWCSMRACGSRAKAKAYRERHRANASPTGS